MASSIQSTFQQKGVFIPQNIKPGRFVFCAADNTNLQESSSWTANCQKTDLIAFAGALVTPRLQQQPIQLSDATKVLGITTNSGLPFKMQQNIARGNLSTKWNMITPHLHAGLSMWTNRKILTAVIIPKACYGSHLWDTNHTIPIYNQIKEMLRIPYNPSRQGN